MPQRLKSKDKQCDENLMIETMSGQLRGTMKPGMAMTLQTSNNRHSGARDRRGLNETYGVRKSGYE
jgi:hypothetical protein